MTGTSTRGPFRAAAVVALVGLTASACDMITGRDRPEEVRLVVDGEDLNHPVRVITSDNFFFGVDERGQQIPQFVDADTVDFTDVPYDQTYELAPTYMLLARALMPAEMEDWEGNLGEDEPEPTGTMSMRFEVEGDPVFETSRQVGSPDTPPGPMQYFIIER